LTNKKIIHLSHIDLDGYGCQMVTNKLTLNEKIYYNTNYDTIDEKINDILNFMKDNEDNYLFLITDLNLTIETSTALDLVQREEHFDLLLIDHHASGENSAKLFDWYHLDTSKSATALTFNHFKKIISKDDIELTTNSHLIEDVVDLINRYDLWNKDDMEKFNKASFLSSIIYENAFSVRDLRLQFNIEMIEKIGKILANGSTFDAECQYPIETQRLLEDFSKKFNMGYLSDKNIPSKIRMYLASTKTLYKNIIGVKDDVLIFGNISSSVAQYCFDYLFSSNEMVEYNNKTYYPSNCTFIKLSSKGTMSIRSTNCTAKTIAEKLGGGGHPNAAGAHIEIENKDTLDDICSRIIETI